MFDTYDISDNISLNIISYKSFVCNLSEILQSAPFMIVHNNSSFKNRYQITTISAFIEPDTICLIQADRGIQRWEKTYATGREPLRRLC